MRAYAGWRSVALIAVTIGVAFVTPAPAQSPPAIPPAMPAVRTPAQQDNTLSTLNGMITGYTPTPAPAGKAPLGGTIDANAGSLLNQLRAKGIAVRMINLFTSSGGDLKLVDGTKLSVGGASATQKYDVDTKTITVGTSATDANHNLKANLSTGTLAQIAHEFWHAYKAQIVDGGFDPDTAAVFNSFKIWLTSQNVTYMNGTMPGAHSTFMSVNPGYFASTKPTYTDDFADEYIAAIITDMFNYGPYLGGEHDATRTYDFFAHFLSDWHVGYFNDNGNNYRVDAPPPPDLILQLERLVITNLTPRQDTAAGTGNGAGQPQPQTVPGEVAPEHSMFVPGSDSSQDQYVAEPRQPEQTQINCFGDAACERALAQARGETNLDFGNRGDDRRSPGQTPGVPGGPADTCYAAGFCAQVPGFPGGPSNPGTR